MLEDIAIGAGGLWFDSWTGQIGRSVANALPPQRRFFGAVLARCLAAEMALPLVTRLGVIPRV